MSDPRVTQSPSSTSPVFERQGVILRGWLRRVEVDRAVFFGVLSRLWQLLAGPITLLLIARHMTPASQGFYYTFASLLALQTFLELGFHLVITNFASHEWARLRLDEKGTIAGDHEALSRLVSLGRIAFRWYAVASAVFIVGVTFVGIRFFSDPPHPEIDWQAPWIALVAITGVVLWTLPFMSILEGCNQVAVVNRTRLVQGILGNLTLWATIVLGGGLWAAPAWTAVSLAGALYLVLVRYRRFFRPFWSTPASGHIDWKREIWPMQWRLGLSGLVHYFAFSLFTPVMFRYHGADAAGRMGMTWTIVAGIQSIALMWIYPMVPRFGMLISARDWEGLDRIWLRKTLASLFVISLGATAAWLLVYMLNLVEHPLASRLLPPLPTALLLLAVVVAQVGQCHAAYLRAHKREPIMVMSVTTSLLAGLMVWALGSRFGPIGAVGGYLGVVAGVTVPWGTVIWSRCKAEWHT